MGSEAEDSSKSGTSGGGECEYSDKSNSNPTTEAVNNEGDVVASDATSTSIGNELEDLIGMKCMAPHQENWGQIGYYCAMVSGVLSLENGN